MFQVQIDEKTYSIISKTTAELIGTLIFVFLGTKKKIKFI